MSREKLRNYAFGILAKREVSVGVLREKIEAKASKYELDVEVVESVVDEFVSKDWVSDDRFCEGYVRDQILKRNGPIKIKYNARKYRLERDLVASKIELLYPEDHQLEVLKVLLENKAERIKKRNKKISDYELKEKLSVYLLGKGFSYDLVRTTCSEFF